METTNFKRYISIKQKLQKFLNLTSVYQNLNFKIFIKITVAN